MSSSGILEKKKFAEIDLSDPFFDSLKEDYREFEEWFSRKKDNHAFVMSSSSGKLAAFLYLKVEDGEVTDVLPNLPAKRRMKLGTFKIEAHGTKLGERFIKRAIDETIRAGLDEIYLTIFEKHKGLISLIERYGFVAVGTKTTANGSEVVFSKTLPGCSGDIVKDYPTIHTRNRGKFLLGIYPVYHTRLLPDSILNNESFDILEDVSHTNSIHKIYICWMRGVSDLQPGDVLVVYRTSDEKGSAYYRSVATSIAVVRRVLKRSDFSDEATFISETEPRSVFSKKELQEIWRRPGTFFVIHFLYSAAFQKRVNRKALLDHGCIDAEAYAGFMRLTDAQFKKILELGGIEDRLVVD